MDLIDVARSILASGPLCDSCLGRPVADRSFGLTNAERGRALRTTVALAADEPYEDPEAECWVCEGVCERFDDLAERAVDALGETALYTYQVGTRVPPLLEENDRLLREEAGLEPDAGEQLKTEVNREVGRRVGRLLGAEVDFERPDVQFLLDLEGAEPVVEVQRNSISVYGRYRKLERGIPQTEWDTYEESVEELVAPPILGAFRGTEAVFHGAGREDVDALMLGPGRPFVLEVKQPRRRDADLADLESAVATHADGKAEVEGLTLVTHEMVERVKEHDATKTYRATVRFEGPVDDEAFEAALEALDGATVEQRTPHRVDHRRADRVRERDVLAIDGDLGGGSEGEVDGDRGTGLDGAVDGDRGTGLDGAVDSDSGEALEGDRQATVDVHGEGGLYIKELVSGDEGRTEPSLAGLLGVGATVTALDVVDVTGVGDPFLTDDYRLERPGDAATGSA